MAADNKLQSSPEKETLSTAQVGNGGQAKPVRKLRLPKTGKKKLLYALIAIVVLVGGWLVLTDVFHVGQKVYAQAAGHRVYRKDIDNLIGNTKGVSDHNAATVLANQYLTEAMAKKADVKVSNQDLVAQYPNINDQKMHNKFAYQGNVNNVYFNKLMAYNAGLYTGQLLVTNFSRNIPFQSSFLDFQKATNPSLGNPAAIAADKTYAHDFITKLYNQVRSGQISFDQAIQAEHNDPVVGTQAYQTLAHSGPFDTSNIYLGANALIAPVSIKQKIGNMKAGQLSAPFAVSVSNSATNKKIKTESYYLVVKMDSTRGSHSGLTYSQYLTQAKQKLGYKIYV